MENKMLMGNEACGRCGGEGAQASLDEYERQRGIEDTCYHCGGSGKVDAETAREDRLEALAGTIAAQRARAEREAYDSDPEGDGWDFCAAENGMTGHELLQVRAGEMTEEAALELAKLSPEVLDALVALLK
jgi:hypothetical protein